MRLPGLDFVYSRFYVSSISKPERTTLKAKRKTEKTEPKKEEIKAPKTSATKHTP